MTNIIESTKKYETWVRDRVSIIESDLKLKHQHMAEDVFPFMRATFYNWIVRFYENFEEFNKGPFVFGVGDLHVDNFGTWRDPEGRLAWGVNDLDEVTDMSFIVDLNRLAVSAKLALKDKIKMKDICKSLLKGYTENLSNGSEAFVLGAKHHWLSSIAGKGLQNPDKFWTKMKNLPDYELAEDEKFIKKMLKNSLPEKGLKFKIKARTAGLGSLGRQRFVALAKWEDGMIAREIKCLTTSALDVMINNSENMVVRYDESIKNAVRCRDAFVYQDKNNEEWLHRRLAPDCSRIEFSELSKTNDAEKLLRDMGFEVANIHNPGKKKSKKILEFINSLNKTWLEDSCEKMLAILHKDYDGWKKQ